jgi:hypothetical protein
MDLSPVDHREKRFIVRGAKRELVNSVLRSGIPRRKACAEFTAVVAWGPFLRAQLDIDVFQRTGGVDVPLPARVVGAQEDTCTHVLITHFI